MFTYNIFSEHENPLRVMVQRSAGFLHRASVKVGIILDLSDMSTLF